VELGLASNEAFERRKRELTVGLDLRSGEIILFGAGRGLENFTKSCAALDEVAQQELSLVLRRKLHRSKLGEGQLPARISAAKIAMTQARPANHTRLRTAAMFAMYTSP